MIAIKLNVLDRIQEIVGAKYIITEQDELYNYSRDCTSDEITVPVAVVIPKDVHEISAIVKVCNETKTSITVRGGGTGVSGGALAFGQGIILSLQRLNKIVEINTIDRTAVVESGVVTQDLRNAAWKKGLNFPQNISSAESCFIGGNVAVSSGSPKSLKYGPTKNYVLNLEVVLPDGRIIWTGKNVSKNATGYNLTQLFTGSEGQLGIITKVVLKLVPVEQEILMMIPFHKIENLFQCVQQFFVKGYAASSIEFIDKTGFELASKYVSKSYKTKSKVDGVLWIELEGKHHETLMEEAIEISQLIYDYTEEEICIADNPSEVKELWKMRSKVGEAVISHTFFRDVDIVVPRTQIHKMYQSIAEIANTYQFDYTVFGHVGNGNFHVNIFQNQLCSVQEWKHNLDIWLTKIYDEAIKLGGTISGEHGIGKMNLPYIKNAIPDDQMAMMQAIKSLFDKNNILNTH